MKERITILLLLVSVTLLHGQKQAPAAIKRDANIQSTQVFRSAKLSPSTLMLMNDIATDRKMIKARSEVGLDSTLIDSILITKHELRKVKNRLCVGVFLLVTDDYDPKVLESLGFIQGLQLKNHVTGYIPIDIIDTISKLPTVRYIQKAEKVFPMMDKAKIATKVNSVQSGLQLPQPYTGKGVIVGIIDKGFDYTHPNFYDKTGTNYRINRVWEQNASSGTLPSGFSYGRELKTQAEILSAKTDNSTQSHGTHTTGIAAGSGSTTNFGGAAPESDIVLVSSTFTDVGLSDAVMYIANYARGLGKSCVINLSISGHLGPHDGTSHFDQISDDIVKSGNIILVGAAGNEGDRQIHISKLFTQNDTILFSGLKNGGSNTSSNIDIWGHVGTNFMVAVNIFNANTNSWEDYSPYYYTKYSTSNSFDLTDKDFFLPDHCTGTILTEINPINNKPHARILINNTAQDDSYRYAVIEVLGKNTGIDIWSEDNTYYSFFSNLGYNAPFINGSTSSTIGEIGGTGKSIISVGAYTTKNNWIDISGSTQNASFYTEIDAIAPFSSIGPTADDRTKPDVVAPGNVIVSSVNSFDTGNYSTSGINTISSVSKNTNSWYYGAMQGTSMSSPLVAGIIATWLQANPNLTLSQIKQILQKTSIKDTYVGDVNTWGYGKIDAWSGIKEAIAFANTATPSVLITQVYGGGGNSGATYKSDFIELINTTGSDINVGGWCVYYIAATSSITSQKYEFPANTIIKAGSYFSLKCADGTGTTQPAWPLPFDGTCTLPLGGTAGKIVLLKSNAAFTLSNSPLIEEIVNNINFGDYVPYGTTAVPIWGSAMAANTTSTTAVRRKYVSGQYQYTKNIGNDFEIVTADPRNSSNTVGVTKINSENISVYVSQKNLFVKGINENQRVDIYTTTGCRVNSSNISSSNALSLNNLPVGIYIVKVGGLSFKIKL